MKTRRRELSNRRLSPLGRRSVYVIAGDDVPNFFESLGILLRKGHLDTEMVWSVFGYYALRYWQGLGDFFVLDRQTHGDSELWSGFEHLANALHEFEAQRKGRPHVDFPREELDRFFREEMLVGS